MTDMIKDGDIVDVYYCDTGQRLGVEVISTPGTDEGLWYFKDKDGGIIAQNPCATNFECIIKRVQPPNSTDPINGKSGADGPEDGV